MATGTLTGQTIANTYKSLLKITGTTDGGETLHATTLKVIEDGDGNPFPFSAAADAIMINSTNRLEFGDNASYIHQSADGVLDLVSDTEIELTATTIDINGAVDMASTLAVGTYFSLKTTDDQANSWVLYTNTNDSLEFNYNGSGNAEFVIDNSGNVGIGNISPGSMNDSGNNLVIGSGASGDNTGLTIFSNSDSAGSIHFADGTSGDAAYRGIVAYTHTSDAMLFFTSGTEKMRITSGGDIMVGDTSSVFTDSGRGNVEINGSSSAVVGLTVGGSEKGLLLHDGTDSYFRNYANGYFAIYTNNTERMRITSAGTTYISSANTSTSATFGLGITNTSSTSDTIAGIIFKNYDSNAAWIRSIRTGSAEGVLLFGTNSGGGIAESNITERMRINSNGGLCVGTTSGPSAGNIIVNEGIYIGANNGDNQIRSSSAGGGSATLYIGNAAIQVSSDERLKTNIVDTSISALDKINQVRVVDFNWNDPSDTSYNNRNARGLWTGVIAQEIVDVFPFAVNAPRNEEDLSIDNDSESIWQVDQSHLVPTLIKALQEADDKIDALTARIEALEA